MLKTETYQALKVRQGKEIDAFEGLFFAFNNSQLAKGLAKVGLATGDTKKIYSIGAGGYIRKDKSDDFHDLLERHTAEKKVRLQDEKELLEALTYELNNHEFCISHDSQPALDTLGLIKEDIDPKILHQAMVATR